MEIRLHIAKVDKKLSSLGYAKISEDSWLLEFTYDRVDQEIRNATNQKTVPEELEYYLIDKVCGEFLFQKKNMGQLTDKEFSQVVSSLSEGDTSISFQKEISPEEKFNAVINKLCNIDPKVLMRFRKLVW